MKSNKKEKAKEEEYSVIPKIIKPEEKAKKLINTFGKKYALLITDEIILMHNHEIAFDEYATDEYWEDVKKEIKKLK